MYSEIASNIQKNVNNGIKQTCNNIINIPFDSIWNSIASNSLLSKLDVVINKIETQNNELTRYSNVLPKVDEYISMKKELTILRAQLGSISNDEENKDLISSLSNQIAKLEIKLAQLKNSINSSLSAFGIVASEPIEIKGNKNNFNNSENLKPKNNGDISHRGYRTSGIRDNSIEAYRLAGEKGFWGLEADVRFDSNGNLICSHNMPQNEATSPTFEEYLDICKEYGMTAIIDLKYNNYGKVDTELSPAIIRTIQEKGMIDSCVIQTNNDADVPYIRQTSEDVRIWYLRDKITDERVDMIIKNNVECVNTSYNDGSIYRIRKLNELGIDVCVWNVQNEGAKSRLLSEGAKHVMSDNVLGITPYQDGEIDFNNII